MTFWQENYAFIKDVYESRSTKLIELMDKTDKAIANVVADKIYTSNEFKKIKDVFVVRTKMRERYVVFLTLFLGCLFVSMQSHRKAQKILAIDLIGHSS